MDYDRLRWQAERAKKMYPPGTRIELISMNDPYSPVPRGTRGSVVVVDDIGTLHMKWDNGQSLGIVPGEDSFRVLAQDEILAETQMQAEPENSEIYNSPDFQCDQSGGFPTILKYDIIKGKVWLELNESLYYEGDDVSVYEQGCKDWGVRDCRSWEDYNRLLKSLGEDAYRNAWVPDKPEIELGM